MEHFWLFAMAAFLIGASKGGLAAAGALAVPILSLWMDPLVAAGVLLPVYIVSDIVGVWLYRHEYSRKNLVVLVPAGCLGVALATFLVPHITTESAKLATGIIGLAYCLQATAKALLRPTAQPVAFHPIKGAFWGTMTGITSFVSHTGSPPFQAFVLPQRLPKLQFAGTTTITFTAINLFKLPAYNSVGMMDNFDWKNFALMAVVASLGAIAGRQLAKVLPDKIYLRLIQSILFVLSVYLVWSSIGTMAWTAPQTTDLS